MLFSGKLLRAFYDYIWQADRPASLDHFCCWCWQMLSYEYAWLAALIELVNVPIMITIACHQKWLSKPYTIFKSTLKLHLISFKREKFIKWNYEIKDYNQYLQQNIIKTQLKMSTKVKSKKIE